MPNAIANSVTVEYRALNVPADWGEALDWAMGFGYRGTVEMYVDESTNPVWHLELNGDANPAPVGADMTDVIVWNGVSMISMTQDFFTTNYTPA